MKETEYVVGIYNYFNPFPEEGEDAHYFLLYLLGEHGMLEKEVADKLFMDRFNDSEIQSLKKLPHTIGPFVSLDKLNQYAFALCEELNAAKISLLATQEYNDLLENGQLASEFYANLLEKGNVIQNIERKKKGFLTRFFD